MISKKQANSRIELLEGARGLLALWVMIGHFLLFLAVAAILPTSSPFFIKYIVLHLQEGAPPVALFMILSGFVISLLINTKKEPYLIYITRRFLRLFPAFFFCLILGFIISPWQLDLINLPWSQDPWVHHQSSLAILHQHHWILNILAHITMLHGLIPVNYMTDATGAFLGVGWSISTEWQFYLIAPLGIWLSKRRLGMIAIISTIILLSPYLPFINYFNLFINESRSLLLFHIQYFFIGCISYAVWNQWRAFSSEETFLKINGLPLLGAAVAFCITDPIISLWIFVFSCLCQVTANPHAIDSRVVLSIACSSISKFIGKISYSIYLVHWPIAIAALKLITYYHYPCFTDITTWSIFVIEFLLFASLATILASYILYMLIEQPAISWGKRIFASRS